MVPVIRSANVSGARRASPVNPQLLRVAATRGEAEFRRMLDKIPAGAYTCDAEGLITYYNQHAVDVWGREPAINDPIDRWCGSFKLISAEGLALEHDQCWMALALKNGREYNGCEIVVERPDGERRTVLAHANPIRDDSGRMTGAVNVLVDITDRKRAEHALRDSEEQLREMNHLLEALVAARTDELQRSNRALEERNNELEQFAYVASHDLQEPLRMITSFVRLLDRRYAKELDETGRDYIARAIEGTQRMHRLIQDLLSYSRVGTEGRPFVSVDMNAAVSTAMRDLRDRIQETGAMIERDELPPACGDPTQIEQLFQNLLSNALKFRRNGSPPRIEIRVVPDDGNEAWIYSVSDDGIGFEMEHSERLFELFQRLHGRDQFEGTGIGLAICKRIVERHGGRIWATSEPDRGATIHFSLPQG